MRLDVYVPVLAALLFGVAIRPLSRLWTPRAGARLLVCAGLVSASCWVWALGLLGWTLLGQIPTVARYGEWSASVLHSVDPVDPAVAFAAIAILLSLTVLVAITTVRRTRALLRSCALARSLAPAARGDLIVLPDDAVEAFALPALTVPVCFRRLLTSSSRLRRTDPRSPDPGRRRLVQRRSRSGDGVGAGHVVVTIGMLRALEPDERRALFAHERAHLLGHDHWWLLAAQFSSAVNPLLSRLPATVDYLLERAADEHAAEVVGERRLAARALAKAGLAALRQSPTEVGLSRGLALGYGTSAVSARVAALLDPPPRFRRSAVFLLAVAAAVVLGCAIDAGHDVERLFELAMLGPR
jgi:Zn-dependent protease with chaperone function